MATRMITSQGPREWDEDGLTAGVQSAAAGGVQTAVAGGANTADGPALVNRLAVEGLAEFEVHGTSNELIRWAGRSTKKGTGNSPLPAESWLRGPKKGPSAPAAHAVAGRRQAALGAQGWRVAKLSPLAARAPVRPVRIGIPYTDYES